MDIRFFMHSGGGLYCLDIVWLRRLPACGGRNGRSADLREDTEKEGEECRRGMIIRSCAGDR